MLFHVLGEVMFAVFLTLLLADIPWTSGKYFALKTTLFVCRDSCGPPYKSFLSQYRKV